MNPTAEVSVRTHRLAPRIRAGALLLLPLFVLYTGDGLASHLCHESPPEATTHHQHHDGMSHGTGDHDSEHDSDHECPMGDDGGLACAGGVTAPTLVGAAPAETPVERTPRIRDPGSIAGTLLSFDLFRPPRI